MLVTDGKIAEISDATIAAGDAHRIDLKGRTLMPGLIDCHVHVTAISANFAELARTSPFYVSAKAGEIMNGMLRRGFTTVRDVGGADHGLARAVEEGLYDAPRLMFCGKALSPTGGHGDVRAPGVEGYETPYAQPGLGYIVDGVPEMRRAARGEIRRGAHHLKIMGGGGISSPTDRITSDQFSEEEIAAVVEEAEMANLYVAVHAYTARSIERCVKLGVRTIEHGNLATQDSIKLMKKHGAILVPTLAIYRALVEEGVQAGLPEELVGKTYEVLDAGINAVEMAYKAGVEMAYGTDLLGSMHRRQLSEFRLRAEGASAADHEGRQGARRRAVAAHEVLSDVSRGPLNGRPPLRRQHPGGAARFVLEADARQPLLPRLAQQPGERLGRALSCETAAAVDIGDAVALGIAPAEARRVGDVDAETVGHAEARALADQHGDEARAQAFADFVAERDAGLARQHDRADAPAGEQRCDGFDHLCGVTLDAGGR